MTSAVAAILVGMNPILATVLSRGILPSERLTLLGAVSLLLGLGGVGLVASPDPADLLASDFIATGFVLLTAVSIALGSVLIQRVGSSLYGRLRRLVVRDRCCTVALTCDRASR